MPDSQPDAEFAFWDIDAPPQFVVSSAKSIAVLGGFVPCRATAKGGLIFDMG